MVIGAGLGGQMVNTSLQQEGTPRPLTNLTQLAKTMTTPMPTESTLTPQMIASMMLTLLAVLSAALLRSWLRRNA
jgi:hypothetical protein